MAYNKSLSKAIGQQIFSARQKYGWTQEELACKVEVTNRAISSYEQGRAMPSAVTLLKLILVLGLDSGFIYEMAEKQIDYDREMKFLKYFDAPARPVKDPKKEAKKQIVSKMDKLTLAQLGIIESVIDEFAKSKDSQSQSTDPEKSF